jgi:predicted ribonuclease YlaK
MKHYIIDTNILITDPNAITNLLDGGTNKVTVPINVLMELDKLKNDIKVGYLARKATNELIKLREQNKVTILGSESSDWIDNYLASPDGKILDNILKSKLNVKDDNIFLTNDNIFSMTSEQIFAAKKRKIKVEPYNTKGEYISDPVLFNGFLKSSNVEDNFINVANYFTWNEGKLNFNNKKKSRAVAEQKVWTLSPRHYTQKMMIDLILNDDIKLLSVQGQAGFGKAQPLDSKVLTPNGWIRMGDIKIGDVVSTPDSTTASVVGVYPQGEIDIYQVTFNDGTKTECCGDHLWKVRTYCEKHKYKVKTTNELKDDLYVKTKVEGKGQRIKYFNFPLECAYMDEKPIPIHPYVIGVLLGDGTLYSSYTKLTSNDPEIIEECRRLIGNDIILEKTNDENNMEYTFIKKIRSSSFVKNSFNEILKSLDLAGKKSYEKYIPKDYLFNSKQNRIELLQGLMDTDGFVSDGKVTKEISYCSTSYQLCLGVMDLVRSLGGKATINQKKTFCYTKGYEKEGRPAWNVNINFSNDVIPFKLKRKVDRFLSLKKYPVSKGIKSIEYIGKKEAQCISIDHKDHLYITDDFISTHNTVIALACALYETFEKHKYKKIVFVKPMFEIGNSMGFLPGDVNDKIGCYFEYALDLLLFLSDQRKATKIFDDPQNYKKINEKAFKFMPLNFIRGQNLNETLLICDEFQNANKHELKSILTRCGEGTKAIILGDVDQIDNAAVNKQNNAISALVRNMLPNDKYAHIVLSGKQSRGPVCDMILNSGI